MILKRLLHKLLPPPAQQTTPQAPYKVEPQPPEGLPIVGAPQGNLGKVDLPTHYLQQETLAHLAPPPPKEEQVVFKRYLPREMAVVLAGNDPECPYEYTVGRDPTHGYWAVLVHTSDGVLERSYTLEPESTRDDLEKLKLEINISDNWVRAIRKFALNAQELDLEPRYMTIVREEHESPEPT